ncbi:MAG: TetR/AcrR family transcriptional regulator [Microthrixaceae bacterium]
MTQEVQRQMTRTRLTEAEGRAALLDAATEIVTETGSPNVTVREVAARAGINHGLVHRYFGTKDTLIAAVIDEIAARVARELTDDSGEAVIAGDEAGTLARLIGSAMVAGSNDIGDGDRPHPVADVLVERCRTRSGLSEDAARVAAAQVVALTLGWRLNEPFLVSACGLDDHDVDDLRRELFRTCQRVVASMEEPARMVG